MRLSIFQNLDLPLSLSVIFACYIVRYFRYIYAFYNITNAYRHDFCCSGGPLTPKFDRATGPFLKIDRQH